MEASLVIFLALLLVGSLLLGIFSLHAKTAGRLVLAEALERNVFFEERFGEEKGLDREAILAEEREKLRIFWRCGEKELSVTAGLLTFSGTVSGPGGAEWRVSRYHPEAALRLAASVKGARAGETGNDKEKTEQEGVAEDDG